jgi:hypothetical protein
MKGIVTILEVAFAGVVLVLAFLHFFPQYSIKTQWDPTLLDLTVRDTLNTIDRLNKTYDFARDSLAFDRNMSVLFSSQYTGTPMIWWKDVDNLPEGTDTRIPYFSNAKKATIIDVINTTDGFKVYSFTLGLGHVY